MINRTRLVLLTALLILAFTLAYYIQNSYQIPREMITDGLLALNPTSGSSPFSVSNLSTSSNSGSGVGVASKPGHIQNFTFLPGISTKFASLSETSTASKLGTSSKFAHIVRTTFQPERIPNFATIPGLSSKSASIPGTASKPGNIPNYALIPGIFKSASISGNTQSTALISGAPFTYASIPIISSNPPSVPGNTLGPISVQRNTPNSASIQIIRSGPVLKQGLYFNHVSMQGSISNYASVPEISSKPASIPRKTPDSSRVSKSPKPRLHVVLTFPILEVKNPKEEAQIRQRMMEYKLCLTKFLSNDNVERVHLLYDSPNMPYFIQRNIEANPKLNLHKVQSLGLVVTVYQFVFTQLQGKLVVITQADIILGEGFDKVNKTTLVDNRLVYALSRHESPCGKLDDMCHVYIGSHDAFIFVPQGELNNDAIKQLSHAIGSWGTENLIMYVFARILKYRILNPCYSIKIYHFHCSNYRPNVGDRKRVNKIHSLISSPTNRLV